MSIYYIVTGEDDTEALPDVYMLDATETVEQNLPVQSTNFTVEDGSDISDNIALRPRTVSFSGVISDIKPASSKAKKKTIDYIKGLEDIRDKRELFSIYYSVNKEPLTNVFFESLNITQDSTNGTLRVGEANKDSISSFKVSFTVKEFRLSEKAKAVEIKANELNIDKETDSNAASQFDDSLKPQTKLWEQTKNYAKSLGTR